MDRVSSIPIGCAADFVHHNLMGTAIQVVSQHVETGGPRDRKSPRCNQQAEHLRAPFRVRLIEAHLDVLAFLLDDVATSAPSLRGAWRLSGETMAGSAAHPELHPARVRGRLGFSPIRGGSKRFDTPSLVWGLSVLEIGPGRKAVHHFRRLPIWACRTR